MPSITAQHKANEIIRKLRRARTMKMPFEHDMEALIPSILHQVFNGSSEAA